MCCAAGPPAEAWRGSESLLRSDQTQPHFRPVLWRQQQRHPQETPQHGCEELRVSMSPVSHVHDGNLWHSWTAQEQHWWPGDFISKLSPHLYWFRTIIWFRCKYFSELLYWCYNNVHFVAHYKMWKNILWCPQFFALKHLSIRSWCKSFKIKNEDGWTVCLNKCVQFPGSLVYFFNKWRKNCKNSHNLK